MPMTAYRTPGIYVEEVPAGPRPIQAVGTSTAAFLGDAPVADAFPNQPRAINNWSEFMRYYMPEDELVSSPLANAVFGFFENGGTRCFVVNTAGQDTLTDALGALETEDEVAIVAAPGRFDAASHDALLRHCETLLDRVAILDPPEEVDDIGKLTQAATAEAPRRRRGGQGETGEGQESGGSRGRGDEGPKAGGLRPRQSDRGYGAFYFPWVTVMDPVTDSLVNVPPSGHMAGIWARTDATRGVHKAPANESVRGALNLTYRLTRSEQGVLNDAGVNCLRLFAREGIRVWGARTIADAASEWRYLNVRRLFNMVEESIAEGTNWVVFEPNDQTLWKSIRRDIGSFLTRVWRDGALLGATPEEAFFVKCDAETNPPDVIDAGQVVALIGLAPVKPAEFVVFRVMQSTAGAEVTSATPA
jgi:phage tail sheath protein FI